MVEAENGGNGRSPKRLKIENLNEKTDGQQNPKIKPKVNRKTNVNMEQMTERKKRIRMRKKEMEEKKKKEQQKQSQSSEEQINLLPPSATNLPFGELEENETYTYEQHKASLNFNRSISLGTVPEIRFLKIKNLCDMTISMKAAGEASKEKSTKEQRQLAVAAQIGLRNAFCHFYFHGLSLPSAFDIKLPDKNNSNKNKKLETISELVDSFETDKNDNEKEKAMKRIGQSHYMLIDLRVEEIGGSDTGTFKLRFRAPYMFTALRAIFDHPPLITSEELIRSIAEKPLKLMPNPAQSGATFLRTNDAQFFIKSADQNEMKFFQTFLDRIGKQKEQINFFVGGIWDYYEYFRDQLINGKRTLLPKYFAIFDLKNSKSKEHQNFIMMNSVFPQNFPKIHYKFDLKGASINRKELKFGTSDEARHKTCRDLDFFRFNSEDKNGTMVEGLFRHGICIDREQHEELAQLLENDTWFLKAHNIMDYSLLMGVHFVGKEKLPDEWLDELPFGVFHGKCNNCKNPFRNVYENDQKLLISIGIIDTLQTYDYPRELEDLYKSSVSIFRKKDGFLFPPETRQKYKPNSVKHPSVYRNRFREAILTVFLRPNCISSPENDEIIHEKKEYKAESQSKEFIFKAKAEKSDQKTAQEKLISPSRKQLERRKQQEQILEDLRKLDQQIPLKFRKNKPKIENFEKKTTINRAISLPINFKDEMPKRTKKKTNNEKKISKN
ncbi:hypothetical protein niasHT_001005 [Heterodera trifolii]|uniref:PIPK domain-containing protein n=1 Tax=Heterodera trifolii TaxID=157864 RepID=A0ABD2LT91_9BILA